MSESRGCSPKALRIRASLTRGICSLFLACFALACLKSGEKPHESSGETHFLSGCHESCGAGLSCICGVCTEACAGSAGCGKWSTLAVCRPLAAQLCQGEPGPRVCEVTCDTNADCEALGEAHRCVAGVCRAAPPPLPPPLEDAALADASLRADTGVVDGAMMDGASVTDAAADASAGPSADAARPDAASEDAATSAESGAGTPCGASLCGAGQRCCDPCSNQCVSQFAEIACPADRDPSSVCADAAVSAASAACGLPADFGFCDNGYPGHVHDPQGGACIPVFFGRCGAPCDPRGGNANCFLTREACEGACDVTNSQTVCAADRDLREVCVACGLAGGCSETRSSCARRCTVQADCQAESLTGRFCLDGHCQPIGGCR